MGNNPVKPHADTFLEVISGTSSLPEEKNEEVFRNILANISKRKVLNNVKNIRGEGPVACACYSSNTVYLDTLLADGFDWSKDGAGNTPLHTATILENEYAIEKISGRWPNLLGMKNSAGKTPLDISTEAGLSSITSLLVRMIEKGDDPFLRYQKHINPVIRKMFIHLDRFRNRVKADFAGAQGVIYLADMVMPNATTVKVALKGATARASSGDAAILREIKVLHQALSVYVGEGGEHNAGHPNIINFFGFTLDDRFVYLVSPYTPLGDLHQWILKHASFYIPVDLDFLPPECKVPEYELSNDEFRQFRPAFFTDIDLQDTTIRFLCQIARGLKYLHSLGIIHNDIKPMNCLLFTDSTGRFVVKLIDFGLSVMDQDPDFLNTPLASPATIPYVATERLGLVSIFSNPPSVKTDMYAFGATAWHLITGKKPYYYVAHRTPKMSLPLVPAVYIGDDLGAFVNMCISNNPGDRPLSFDAIVDADKSIIDSSDSSGDSCEDSGGSYITKTASSDDISGEVVTLSNFERVRKSPSNPFSVAASLSSSLSSSSSPNINTINAGMKVPLLEIPANRFGITTGPYRIPSPRKPILSTPARLSASPVDITSASVSTNSFVCSRNEIEKIRTRFLEGGVFVLDQSEITTDMIIGEGNFGRVFRGYYTPLHHPSIQKRVAIKVLKHINSFSSEEKNLLLEEFIKESSALSKLANVERISRVVGVTIEPLQLVMDLYPKGSMADVLRREPDLHFITRVSLIKDIAEGLMNIHTNYGVHRDIAARNILVDEDYRAYISDFGKTRFSREQYAHTKDKVVAVKWASPESFTDGGDHCGDHCGEMTYSFYTDIWAFGVTVYEILTNEEPYRDVKHETMIRILREKKGPFLQLPDTFDDELHRIIEKCLSWNPEDRSDMEEHFVELEIYLETLINHRWWLGRKHFESRQSLSAFGSTGSLGSVGSSSSSLSSVGSL